MKVTLYTIYKKTNSTLQPTADNPKFELEVNLKEDTSMYYPTFLINIVFSANNFPYNYLKWQGRYYFIDDIVKPTINNVWELVCSIDLLATFKTDILTNTTAFVKYSANNFNPMIPDDRLSYPAIKSISMSHYELVKYNLEPSIVVTYISAKDSGYGSVAYAVLNKTQLTQLNKKLMSTEFQDSLNKQLDSTASAIVSCLLFPFTLSGDTPSSSMNVLGVDTGIHCAIIKDIGIMKGTIKLNWTSFEQNYFGDYRDLEPFRTYMIFLPAYGYVDIPASYIITIKGTTIDVDYIIDELTGGISYNIDGVGKFDGTIAVNIPTAYSGINAINTISSGIATGSGVIGNLLSGNIGGAVSTALSGGFNTYVNANMKNCGTIGSTSGSRASLLINPYDIGNGTINICLFVSTLDGEEPYTIREPLGRPCNKVLQLVNCTGYTQTQNASANLQAPKSLIDQINEMLDSGIYIE